MRMSARSFSFFFSHFFIFFPSPHPPKKGPKRIREQTLILTGRGLEVEAHGRIGEVALLWVDEWGKERCIILLLLSPWLSFSLSPKLSEASVSASRLWYKQKQLSRYESQQRENIINTSSALERARFCSKVGCEGHIVTKSTLNLLWDSALNSRSPTESSYAASAWLS